MSINAKNGRWLVEVWQGQERRRAWADTERQAERKQIEFRRELEASKPARPGSLTYFRECLELYFTKRGKSWDQGRKDRLTNDLGKERLDRLTLVFDGWLELYRRANTARKRPPALATVNRLIQLAKAATAHACRMGLIDADPLRVFRVVPENNRRDATVSDLEWARLYRTLPAWLQPIALFAYLVPTRRGELEKARVEDIQWERQCLLLRRENNKTGTERLVPIPDRMLDYFKAIPGPWVFYRRLVNGTVRPLGDFHKTWDAARKAAKVPDLRFHDLRGVSSSRLDAAGVPRSVIDKLAGWADHSMLARYRRIGLEELHRAIGNQLGSRHLTATEGQNVAKTA